MVDLAVTSLTVPIQITKYFLFDSNPLYATCPHLVNISNK